MRDFLYNCEKCTDSFKSNKSLKVHIDSVHEGAGFQCTICRKHFSCHKSLKNHEDKKKRCKHCDYFSCWKTVDKHMSTIHNEYFTDGF